MSKTININKQPRNRLLSLEQIQRTLVDSNASTVHRNSGVARSAVQKIKRDGINAKCNHSTIVKLSEYLISELEAITEIYGL